MSDLDHRTFTAEEFARIERPPCPVCGAPAEIQRLDVTANAGEEARQGRSYIAGMPECPHGCDPLTGERRHDSHTIRAHRDGGYTLECSCGGTAECPTFADLAAAARAHQMPVAGWHP